MSITFKVDDVEVAQAPRALVSTESALAELLEDSRFTGESGLRAGPPLAWVVLLKWSSIGRPTPYSARSTARSPSTGR